MNKTKSPPQASTVFFSDDGDKWALFDAKANPIDVGEATDWSEISKRISSKGLTVLKVVLGTLETSADETRQVPGENVVKLLQNVALQFPCLTHLHLWQVKQLKALPKLPESLRCLDIRRSPDLQALTNLPGKLDTLILEDCPRLATFPSLPPAGTAELKDLSFKGCVDLEESRITEILAKSPQLRKLDVSGCKLVKTIPDWPKKLVSVKLNDCTHLSTLPDYWPVGLYRLEISGTAIRKLPELTANLDYIDLSFTRELQEIEKDWDLAAGQKPRPRTLFLHGSGLLMPPATEQGESRTDNVAGATRAYFEDVKLAGKGEVKRCKLLILGNGEAGKTCLSLALIPNGNPADAEKLGTTHGVQFWDWQISAKVKNQQSNIHVHLWDFGGQEIYHNTHKLFMGHGTVFVLVWKPEQDGQKASSSGFGYRDELRPLRYWLDFIHLACPHKPRIAVVCSHQLEPSSNLQAQFKKEVGIEYEHCDLWFVDSLHSRGELDKLQDWITENVVDVVETQGTAVPSYWEIAQNMVANWLEKMKAEPEFASQHNELSPERFRQELEEEIRKKIQSDSHGRYAKLKRVLEDQQFELTPNRLQRTLSFLTHSGWIFWDEGLFGQRVIVGQKWALDGIYTVLDRRDNEPVYERLFKQRGRFTCEDLAELAWKKNGYSEEEQKLLLSFMERVGVCFRLVSEKESRWNEPVYISLAHLPSASELKLPGEFHNRSDAVQAKRIEVPSAYLHKGHWQAMLVKLGGDYGTDAEYASDGFFLPENKEGQGILLQADFNDAGIGGKILVSVAGGDADQRLKKLEAFVQGLVPVAARKQAERGEDEKSKVAGEVSGKIRLFISYTWQPQRREDAGLMDCPVPIAYEEPVNRIEKALQAFSHQVAVLRDKNEIRDKDSITQFMYEIKKSEKVLIVHSDKYFRSSYCMLEFWQVLESFMERGANIRDTLLLVELANSPIFSVREKKRYIDFWDQVDDMPVCLEKLCTLEELKTGVLNVLRSRMKIIHDCKGINRQWNDQSAKDIIEWIKSELGLKTED